MDEIKIAKELGINLDGTFDEDDSYVIDIPNDDLFGKIYSRFEDLVAEGLLDNMESNSMISEENLSVIYRYEDVYQLNLIANLVSGVYKLVISEL